MLDRLIDVLVQCFHFLIPWSVVDCYQKAVVLRFGRHHRTLEPGFHWVWPLGVEHVLHANVVTNTSNLGVQSLTTKDGYSISISGLLTWRVVDPAKFLLEVEGGQEAISDLAYGAIADSVKASTWAEVSEQKFADGCATKLRRRASKYGLEIDRLQFSDLTKCRALRLWAGAH